MLKDRILNKDTGLIFYSITPPKRTTDLERVGIIAEKQMDRLKNSNIDGLILYDIQDESARTDTARPFNFIPTLPPEFYSRNYLSSLKAPKIIYKSIAHQSQADFKNWLDANSDLEYAVFVGASSQQQVNGFTLRDAYEANNAQENALLLGGVTIPERHMKKGDEHLRLFSKMDQGCRFFISQCVYSTNNAKTLLSDHYYATLEEGRTLMPLIFTLAPCGSLKTLQFMEWLGIDVPKWLYNDLKHSKDILARSVDTCKNIALELMDYATTKQIPIGFNIESVSIKKEEIDASIELLNDLIKIVKSDAQPNIPYLHSLKEEAQI